MFNHLTLVRSIFLIIALVVGMPVMAAAPNSDLPTGHTDSEKEELWHLSEGADVFPLRWFLHITSLYDRDPSLGVGSNNTSFLYHRLAEKHGVVDIRSIVDEKTYMKSYGAGAQVSPMKWVGMTLAWSEPSQILTTTNDIKIPAADKPIKDHEARRELVKIDELGALPVTPCNAQTEASGTPCSPFGGQVKIPMVGTNCVFCHSGQIKFKDKADARRHHTAFVEGAPNMLNVRGFFADMIQSTIAVMLDKNKMASYSGRLAKKGLIGDISEADARKFGRKFSKDFKGNLERLPWVKGGKRLNIGNFFKGLLSDEGKRVVIKDVMSDARNTPVIREYLVKMLAFTYNISIDQVENTPTLSKRIEWILKLVTTDPAHPTTKEGYGRTDAFGRISNAVARGDYQLPLIAPVSFPPMWGMKYSSLFHFNGNTNSVLMRNLGQPLGLGALIIDEEAKTTTINMYNINRLEQLIYQIPYPEWNTLAKGLEVDTSEEEVVAKIEAGCNVYVDKCMGCHRKSNRVGPAKKLVYQQVYPFDHPKVGTDTNYTRIQATPIVTSEGGEIPFRLALFGTTKLIKDRYQEIMMQNPEANPLFADAITAENTMREWSNYIIRGTEFFRDTVLGEFFDIGSFPWLADWLKDSLVESATPEDLIARDLDYMKLESVGNYGYIAKDLAGVWASAPYLHNASVPTIWALVSPPEDEKAEPLVYPSRDEVFYTGCRVYDDEKLGYVWTARDWDQVGCKRYDDLHKFEVNEEYSRTIKINGKEDSTYGNGNSNRGHNVFVQDIEKRKALMTFLKVLQPTDEYSWVDKDGNVKPAPYEFIDSDGNGTVDSCKGVPVELETI